MSIGTSATSSCQIWVSKGVPRQGWRRTWTSASAAPMAPTTSSRLPSSAPSPDQSMAAGLSSSTSPARPEHEPDDLRARGQRPRQQGHHRHHPQRDGVGQDRRSSGGDVRQGQVHHGDAQPDREQAVADDDGPVGPVRPVQPSGRRHQHRQHGDAAREPQHAVGEGRDRLQPDLDHDPVAAPHHHQADQQQPGAVHGRSSVGVTTRG